MLSFCWFPVWLSSEFQSSWSTVDLLAVASDKIAWVFNRSRSTRGTAFDISEPSGRVWHGGFLHKLKSYEILGQLLGLISSFSFFFSRMVLDGKSIQEYPVSDGVPQGSIFGPKLFLLYINDLLDDGFSNFAIYADDTTLGQEVACWFQSWKNSTGFIWPV